MKPRSRKTRAAGASGARARPLQLAHGRARCAEPLVNTNFEVCRPSRSYVDAPAPTPLCRSRRATRSRRAARAGSLPPCAAIERAPGRRDGTAREARPRTPAGPDTQQRAHPRSLWARRASSRARSRLRRRSSTRRVASSPKTSRRGGFDSSARCAFSRAHRRRPRRAPPGPSLRARLEARAAHPSWIPARAASATRPATSDGRGVRSHCLVGSEHLREPCRKVDDEI